MHINNTTNIYNLEIQFELLNITSLASFLLKTWSLEFITDTKTLNNK